MTQKDINVALRLRSWVIQVNGLGDTKQQLSDIFGVMGKSGSVAAKLLKKDTLEQNETDQVCREVWEFIKMKGQPSYDSAIRQANKNK